MFYLRLYPAFEDFDVQLSSRLLMFIYINTLSSTVITLNGIIFSLLFFPVSFRMSVHIPSPFSYILLFSPLLDIIINTDVYHSLNNLSEVKYWFALLLDYRRRVQNRVIPMGQIKVWVTTLWICLSKSEWMILCKYVSQIRNEISCRY